MGDINFVPEIVTTFQDAFQSFDKDSLGYLSTRVLSKLLKQVGENPSDAEVQDLMIEVDPWSSEVQPAKHHGDSTYF